MVSLQLAFLQPFLSTAVSISFSTSSTTLPKQGLHVTHTFLAVPKFSEMLSQSMQQLHGNFSLQDLNLVSLNHAVLTP